MITTVMFDLDGTLLSMDATAFTNEYFRLIKDTFDFPNNKGERILQGVLAGMKAMMKNTGNDTNEMQFWNAFSTTTKLSKEEIEPLFKEFYTHEFTTLKRMCTSNIKMVEALYHLKEKGYRLLLVTNPFFPKIAVEERVRWAGVDPQVFDLVTSFESSHAAKPSSLYYEEAMAHAGVSSHECIMVGNDTKDDGGVLALGVPLYLIEDDLITHPDLAIQPHWSGSGDAFLSFVKTLKPIQ